MEKSGVPDMCWNKYYLGRGDFSGGLREVVDLFGEVVDFCLEVVDLLHEVVDLLLEVVDFHREVVYLFGEVDDLSLEGVDFNSKSSTSRKKFIHGMDINPCHCFCKKQRSVSFHPLASILTLLHFTQKDRIIR